MRQLGPGLVTGAADNDPSGIATYAIAGAAFGYATLWTALLCLPLMSVVQLMCGRLGVVTKRGLATEIRENYPVAIAWGACLILVVANTFNLAADFAGMVEVTEMVVGIHSPLWAPAFAVILAGLLMCLRYRTIARILKWLALPFLAYVIAAFLSHPNWLQALQGTVAPRLQWSSHYWANISAILGTTISPYLFFWQTSQEAEETHLDAQKKVSTARLNNVRTDVFTGMLVSNVIMFFIILTTAATLNASGKTDIQTARDAAEALRPLAGKAAYLLFALGVIGAAVLAIPILAGSCAYAIAETARWRGVLDDPPRSSPRFYGVFGTVLAVGTGLSYLRWGAMKMLFWSAILNGILAPPLIVLLVLITSNRKVMKERANGSVFKWLGWIAALCMTGADLLMVFS